MLSLLDTLPERRFALGAVPDLLTGFGSGWETQPDAGDEGAKLLERLFAQPQMELLRGEGEHALALRRPMGLGASLASLAASRLAVFGQGAPTRPSDTLHPSSDVGDENLDAPIGANQGNSDSHSEVDVGPKSEAPYSERAAQAVGIVGRDGKAGVWGLAKSLAGPTANNGVINVLKNQLLAANPEMVGVLQPGQPYRMPAADGDQNLPLARAADAIYRAARGPVGSSPMPGDVLWDPAGDQSPGWQNVVARDALPPAKLTNLSTSTPDLRHWRDLAIDKIAGIESRMAELGWGTTPVARSELSGLNSQRFHLLSQADGLDRQIRENTPYSEWTAQEKGQTFQAALTALWGPFGGARVGGVREIGSSTEIPDSRKWSKAEFDQYVAGLRTRATPTKSKANLFEVEQTGPVNYRVIGGGEKVDTDGIDGMLLLEAKHVGDLKRSPYVDGSKAPAYIRDRVLLRQHDEFRRYAAVIADPDVPFEGLKVLTNELDAVPYFQRLMDTYKIPGQVKVVPTNVLGKGRLR